VLALVVAGGCGSEEQAKVGEPAKVSAPPGRGIVTNTVPTGPRDPAANLELLVSQSAPELHNLQVICPQVGEPPNYPFECKFTGDDHRRQTGVAGTIAVYGVYKPTRTYVYETNYRPLKAR